MSCVLPPRCNKAGTGCNGFSEDCAYLPTRRHFNLRVYRFSQVAYNYIPVDLYPEPINQQNRHLRRPSRSRWEFRPSSSSPSRGALRTCTRRRTRHQRFPCGECSPQSESAWRRRPPPRVSGRVSASLPPRPHRGATGSRPEALFRPLVPHTDLDAEVVRFTLETRERPVKDQLSDIGLQDHRFGSLGREFFHLWVCLLYTSPSPRD